MSLFVNHALLFAIFTYNWPFEPFCWTKNGSKIWKSTHNFVGKKTIAKNYNIWLSVLIERLKCCFCSLITLHTNCLKKQSNRLMLHNAKFSISVHWMRRLPFQLIWRRCKMISVKVISINKIDIMRKNWISNLNEEFMCVVTKRNGIENNGSCRALLLCSVNANNNNHFRQNREKLFIAYFFLSAMAQFVGFFFIQQKFFIR